MRSFTFKSILVILGFLIVCRPLSAAQLGPKDFRHLKQAANQIVLDKMHQEYSTWTEGTSQEFRQVFFAQLASLPGLLNRLQINDQDLIYLKKGEAQLTDEQSKALLSLLDQYHGVYFQQFIETLSQHRPPSSKKYILTIESMKFVAALNTAFLGAILLGSGIVPYDSEMGQILAPVATLASVIAVTRPIKVMLEMGRIEKEAKEFDQHIKQLHKHTELKIPTELLTVSFLLQAYQHLQARTCSYVLESD